MVCLVTKYFHCSNKYVRRGRKRVYNEGRVSAVRRWLLNVFGQDYLASGSGIIDVAGGKVAVDVYLNAMPQRCCIG